MVWPDVKSDCGVRACLYIIILNIYPCLKQKYVKSGREEITIIFDKFSEREVTYSGQIMAKYFNVNYEVIGSVKA